MAAKPLSAKAIALTEKKMDMTLDDIIKMSKNTAATKAKHQRRPLNKSQKIVNDAIQDKALKVRQYMGSRSSVRQGVLAQRRSNFQKNHFPLANEAARKAIVAPVQNRVFNGSMVANKMKRSRVGAMPVQRKAANGSFVAKKDNAVPKQQRLQTLDSLFANMKEQRMRVFAHQTNGSLQRQNNGGVQHNREGRPRLPWARGRLGN
ncbi:uncharacterized protein LOC123204664 [Mangifera indica]|uniref:uncharacterized protein LOC123204664 n=1 Tax=Mangifera indica TaxID=29780 RepID=UPI001CFA72CB|nr:uncharacterized protein LOC123204664 [Mangifera indica]